MKSTKKLKLNKGAVASLNGELNQINGGGSYTEEMTADATCAWSCPMTCNCDQSAGGDSWCECHNSYEYTRCYC